MSKPVLAPLIGDHPALDLINTVAVVDGSQVDFFQSDEDVIAWLAAHGVAIPPPLALHSASLLAAAKHLRASIRAAVQKRKAGQPIDTGELNSILQRSASYLALSPQGDGTLMLTRSWTSDSVWQLLGPIAESAGELLANGDFDLVRECEDEACVLWFYDRTKSHRRKWCSVATCGNRNKVAAFRERKQRKRR